jgi:hypothetical protein
MVRFADSATTRFAIAEMVVARFPGVTADALRAIPVGRVEAWANGAGREHVEAAIKARRELNKSSRARSDGQMRAEADDRASYGTSPAAMVAQEKMRATAHERGVAEEFDRGEAAIGEGGAVLRSRLRNKQLRVPEGQPKPDSFYREVARIYSEVALNTASPAVVIAEANSVKPTTVHGWVKEARRRGLLAPGERQARGSR